MKNEIMRLKQMNKMMRYEKDKENNAIKMKLGKVLLDKDLLVHLSYITSAEKRLKRHIEQVDEYEGKLEDYKIELLEKLHETFEDCKKKMALCNEKQKAPIGEYYLSNVTLDLQYLEKNVRTATDIDEIVRCVDIFQQEMRKHNRYIERSRMVNKIACEIACESRDQTK